MPVADFPGRFGWGYDGVDLFAPTTALRHARRLPPVRRPRPRAGPRRHPRRRLQPPRPGRQLPQAVRRRLLHATATRPTGARRSTSTATDAGPVREFFLANAGYWIDEFHLDGFRFDATQEIFDDSPEHILAADRRAAARRPAGRRRSTWSTRTSRSTRGSSARPSKGGYGLDALWNDDFHHSAMVVADRPQRGVLHRLPRHAAGVHLGGQVGLPVPGPALQLAEEAARHARRSTCRRRRSSTSSRTTTRSPTPARGLRGARAGQPRRSYRAMTALLLLMPQTPMLFQGQEFAASSPFHYFADHKPELAKLVRKGRAKELSQFPSVATPAMQGRLPDPADPKTFERSKLDLAERDRPGHAEIYRAAPDLLQPAARGPGLPPRRSAAATSTARCSGRRRSSCATSATKRTRRRPAAARQLRPRPAPRPAPRAAAGPAGGNAVGGPVVERRPALRRLRHARRPTPKRRAGSSPAAARWCSGRCRRARRRSSRPRR